MRIRTVRYIAALFFLTVSVSALIWRFDIANRTIEFDEGLFLYAADRIDRGVAKYTEDFDNMPPGIYYLYILSFKIFGNSAEAGHLVSAISDIGIVILLFLIGYMLRGPTAAFAASGLYGACFIAVRWAPKGSTENPMTMLILLSLLLYLAATVRFSKRSVLLALIAGASAAGAVMIKQPAVFFLPTLVLHFALLWVSGEQDKGRLKAVGMSFVLGFIALLACVAVWLAAKGILGQAVYNAFIFPFTMQREYGMPFEQRWEEFVQKGLFMAPMLFAMGIGGALALLRRIDEKTILPLFYIAPVFLFLLWTGDFFQHYLIQLLPGLALGAAIILAEVFENKKMLPVKILLIAAMVIFAIGNNIRLYQAYIANTSERCSVFPTLPYRSFLDQHMDEQKAVGRFLQLHMEPDDKLVTSTPTYAYLAGVPNSYSQYYFAPLTRAASNDYMDLEKALGEARFFVIEGWRWAYMPGRIKTEVGNHFSLIETMKDVESPFDVEIWENRKVNPLLP